MTTSESKGRFFLQNESIRIDSHNESNRFESRIGMLYRVDICRPALTPGGLRRRGVWVQIAAATLSCNSLGKLFTPIVPLFTKQSNW